MLQGYISVPIEHFGGLVTAWPPTMLDSSLMVEAQNVRFTASGVSSREGLTRTLATPNPAPVQGLVNYVHLDGTEQPLVLDASGGLYVESPAGSGAVRRAAPGSTFAIPAGAWMNGVAVYNRAYLAFGDGKQGLASPASFDGANLDPVTVAAPAGVATPSDSALAGNVAAGTRYGLVLYQTREGSLSAPQAPFTWTAAGGKQITVSGLPTGSAQVAARVVAFTVAGGSSAGPYYYIGQSQTVNGITETSTVVNDNTTTSATFNFDDAFLASSSDVTDQFRAIELPPQCGVVYSQITQRLMWWGNPAQPSVVQCSQPADAGVYLGDTGFFQVAENDGQRITAVFEFRNQIYVAKEDSLYLVTPNNDEPATWAVQLVSPVVGAAGARAAAVGPDLAVLAHRTGLYGLDGGGLTLLSDELLGPAPDQPGYWERIRWSLGQLVWVAFDHEGKCLHVGVPLDNAQTCSHVLKASYIDGWEPSIRFSAFTARYHYFPGRRWSLDTIAATQAVRVRRPLALPGIAADQRRAVSQLLFASALPTGGVSYLDPASSLDDGEPIAWVLQTGAVSAAEALKQQRQGMELAGLVQLRARGSGSAVVEAVVDGGAPLPVASLALPATAQGDVSCMALAQGEAVGLRLSNQGVAAAMHLQALYVFVRPSWLLRPGR